jgi:hypothetical protein
MIVWKRAGYEIVNPADYIIEFQVQQHTLRSQYLLLQIDFQLLKMKD